MKAKLLTCLALAFLTGQAGAAAVYTYEGNFFNGFSGSLFNNTHRVTGSFTFANPLAPNTALADISTLVLDYSVQNGLGTISSAVDTTTMAFFSVATDATGLPLEWNFLYISQQGSNRLDAESAFLPAINNNFDSAIMSTLGVGGGSAFVIGNPGTWTLQVAPVPVPGALGLLSLGLVSLPFFRRKFC